MILGGLLEALKSRSRATRRISNKNGNAIEKGKCYSYGMRKSFKGYWKYEKEIHQKAFELLGKKFHFNPIICFIPLLILMSYILLSRGDAIMDHSIAIAVTFIAVFSIYAYYRVKAPIEIHTELLDRIVRLENKIGPKLVVLFEQGSKDYIYKAPRQGQEIIVYKFAVENTGVEVVKNMQAKIYGHGESELEFHGLALNLGFSDDPLLADRSINASVKLETHRDLQGKDKIYFNVLELDCLPSGENRLEILHTFPKLLTGPFSGPLSHKETSNMQIYDFKIVISSDNGGDAVVRYFRFDPNQDYKEKWGMLDDREETNT